MRYIYGGLHSNCLVDLKFAIPVTIVPFALLCPSALALSKLLYTPNIQRIVRQNWLGQKVVKKNICLLTVMKYITLLFNEHFHLHFEMLSSWNTEFLEAVIILKIFHCMIYHFQDWSTSSKLMTSSRLSKLDRLQKMTEMREFLDLFTSEGKSFKVFICFVSHFFIKLCSYDFLESRCMVLIFDKRTCLLISCTNAVQKTLIYWHVLWFQIVWM